MRETFVDTVSTALDIDPRLAIVTADISRDAFARWRRPSAPRAARRHPRRPRSRPARLFADSSDECRGCMV
jgi:hypothetical protein